MLLDGSDAFVEGGAYQTTLADQVQNSPDNPDNHNNPDSPDNPDNPDSPDIQLASLMNIYIHSYNNP